MNKAPVYVWRAMLYVLRVAVVIGLVALIFVVAFNTAMNLGSIYIIATEGMELRADVALGNASAEELTNYFEKDWIASDTLVQNSPYAGFKISSYNYTIRLESMSAWAWSSTGTARVVERVTAISGSSTSGETDADGNALTPPAWQQTTYELTLRKDGEGRWYIAGIEEIETEDQAAQNQPSPTAAQVEN